MCGKLELAALKVGVAEALQEIAHAGMQKRTTILSGGAVMTAKQAIVGGAAAIVLAAGVATYVVREKGEQATEETTLTTAVAEQPVSSAPRPGGTPDAHGESVVEAVDEVVLALQYRPELLPSGFKLLDTHGSPSNPGFTSQEKVEDFAAKIGVDAKVKCFYNCVLSREGSNERPLSYHVVETANHAQAVAVAQAWRHDTRAASYHKFVTRNAVVLVVGYGGAEAAAKELMNNLKSAVNYVD